MAESTIDLPGLLGARICHDLISPVGAIGNGMELLALSGDLDGPEKALILESSASANARLQLFRLAFGRSGGGPDPQVSPHEVRTLLGAYSQGHDIEIEWKIESNLSRLQTKTLLLTVLCLETVIGRAGRIAVQSDGTNWVVLAIAGRGTQVLDLLQLLTADDPWPAGLTPAQVQFPLARIALAQSRLAARLTESTPRIVLELANTVRSSGISPEQSRHLLPDI